MTPQERYRQDPLFASLVQMFYHVFASYCGTGAGVTPTEIREASGLAWQQYAERHAQPIMVLPPPKEPL